ncbi:unnamed protein product [Sphagnum jensenii]
MKKHDKLRLKRIKEHQKLAKAKRHLNALVGDSTPDETLHSSIEKLSSKDLKMISGHSDRFAANLVSAANTVLAERAFKLSQ